jgi:hypothetical protein
MRNYALVSLLLVFSVAGCLPKAQPPVMAQLPVPTIRVHGEAQLAADGLDVTITPISGDNVNQFPQVWRTFQVQTPVNSSSGGTTMQTSSASFAIMPLPAFQVRIANNTGHVIRLTSAIFRLESNTGRKWQTFSSTEELYAWNAAMMGTYGLAPNAQAQLVGAVPGAVGGLQLLTRSVELLKGDEWTGYLAFNLGYTRPADYLDLMNQTERFTLRLAELPIETNDAGTATKTTEFNFTLDKATTEVSVVCPAGTTAPSWDICQASK